MDESLEGVGRKGMFFEGYGIDHLHSKLFPMHGTGNNSDFKNIESKLNKYFNSYEGYISSHDCDQEDDKELNSLANKIRKTILNDNCDDTFGDIFPVFEVANKG